MSKPTHASRIESSLVCLAVTDALGGPLEFGPRKTKPSQHVKTMLPNGNFDLPAGHFTDDTSMALCLASSLLESNRQTNKLSQARAYVSWSREGYMSSVPGKCFDIGNQTVDTLLIWEDTIEEIDAGGNLDDAAKKVQATQSQIIQRFSAEQNCGNGSLMRVLPCALIGENLQQAIQLARDSSELTHPHPRCADACEIYVTLVYLAIRREAGKDNLFEALKDFVSGPDAERLDSALKETFESYASIEAFEEKPMSKISSSGYVLHTLEAALWAFFTTDSYEDGAVRVVNLGNDADTVGAVYGGLAGAFYGHVDVIPPQWLGAMKNMDIVNDIVAKIQRLYED